MSERFPRITANELIKFLEKNSFFLVRQSGSHMIYRNSKEVRVTVPFHSGKIIHPKIVKQILNDLELNTEEFRRML